MKRLLVMLSPFIFVSSCIALTHSSGEANHTCRYKNCPYKHYKPSQVTKALIDYTSTFYSADGYKYDSLHIVRPELSYDELETLLTAK